MWKRLYCILPVTVAQCLLKFHILQWSWVMVGFIIVAIVQADDGIEIFRGIDVKRK